MQTSSKGQFLLLNDSGKKLKCFLAKPTYSFLAPLMCFTLTGHSDQHRSFFTNYLQFTMCHLQFYLLANKHQTSYEDVFRHTVSEAAKLGVNVFPTVVYADFETPVHNAVTTVWPGCEVKACIFHLGQSWWWKIYSLGLGKQCGKKYSEVSHVLKKILGLSLLPPAEVSDWFALDSISNLPNDKRANGTVLPLPTRKLY